MTEETGSRPEPHRRTSSGSRWRRVVKAVLGQQGTVCALCGHGGSDSADHILSVRERPDLEWETGNLQPMHFRPCQVCTMAAGKPVRCQYVKGYGSMDTARRLLHERTGLPVPGYSPLTPPEPGDFW